MIRWHIILSALSISALLCSYSQSSSEGIATTSVTSERSSVTEQSIQQTEDVSETNENLSTSVEFKMPDENTTTETWYDDEGALWYYNDYGSWTYDDDGMWYVDNDENMWCYGNDGTVWYYGSDGTTWSSLDESTNETPYNDSDVYVTTQGIYGVLDESDYTVRNASWADIRWTTFQSPYFTLKVPENWEVQWDGNSENLIWLASAPDTYVGISNQAHAYAAKDPNAITAQTTAFCLTNGTVEEFFNKYYQGTTENFTVLSSIVPDNLSVLQSARPTANIYDYRSLYATFIDTSANGGGIEGEGIYSAGAMVSRMI